MTAAADLDLLAEPVARLRDVTVRYGRHTALRDITDGNNGSFAAAAGWDAATGLGSPIGPKVAAALR